MTSSEPSTRTIRAGPASTIFSTRPRWRRIRPPGFRAGDAAVAYPGLLLLRPARLGDALAGEVDHGVDPFEGVVVDRPRGGIPPGRRKVVGSMRADEADGLVAGREQAVHEGLADEAGRSADEYTHQASIARVVYARTSGR